MTALRLRLIQTPAAPGPGPARRDDAAVADGRVPLAAVLSGTGAAGAADLARARAIAGDDEPLLAEVLLANGWASEPGLAAALARQWSVAEVDPARAGADAAAVDRLGVTFWAAAQAVPLRSSGGITPIATARPADFATLAAQVTPVLGPLRMVVTRRAAVPAALAGLRRTRLARAAETRVPAGLSCRGRDEAAFGRRLAVVLALLGIALLVSPVAVLSLLTGLSLLATALSTALKLGAVLAHARGLRRPAPPPPVRLHPRLPVVTMMVPLLGEAAILRRLVERIGRQTYPRHLTDLVLVVEENDAETAAALASVALPGWMRVVRVPEGPIRTKPRALNYALSFARGSIVGIWDAEDDPDPEQLHEIVRRFDTAPADVACLQGVLDYRDTRHNWLARCFTVEYASWFRAQLPGVARLGLVVPLGGTTLFFRREALDRIGGWDAHNVTEDADLGLRLARLGWRTEIVPTVTLEEPNARPLRWIRQRSRWIKGYALTWAVHMRDPARLLRDLGWWRFAGVQVQFLGSILQSLLAPVLWSFWLCAAGLPHPMDPVLTPPVLRAMAAVFILSETVNIGVGLWATRGAAHRHLRIWVPTLHFYFPLAALAAWKALYEVVARPFWWDKTAHGVIADPPASAPAEAPAPA